MTNRVRISYSVPLADIPSEMQRVTKEVERDLELLVESVKELSFTEDFTPSTRRVKLCLEYATAIEARLADVEQIATGYLDLQNNTIDETHQVETPKGEKKTDD